VDGNHPFLSGKVVSEAYYSSNLCPGGGTAETDPGSGANCPTYIDGCDHGTHVAGIAAGNGIGMPGVAFAGVAREAHIIAIQVFSEFSGSICTGAGMSSPCALANSMDIERGLDRIYVLFMEHNYARSHALRGNAPAGRSASRVSALDANRDASGDAQAPPDARLKKGDILSRMRSFPCSVCV
jgi:hypothetical protein